MVNRIIILLFILSAGLYSQNPYYFWWNTQNAVVATPEILTFGIIDTSDVPPAPYTDLCLYITPPQVIRALHIPLLDLNPALTDWGVSWDMKMVGTGTMDIFGQSAVSGTIRPNLRVWVTSDTFRVHLGDTTFTTVKKPTDGLWHSYILWYHSSALELWWDDTIRYSRITTMPEADTTDSQTPYAFCFGLSAQYVAGGYGNTLAGTFSGYLDNLKAWAGDSVVFNTNFNDGYSQQPADSGSWYIQDRALDIHEWKGLGFWLGAQPTAIDARDPVFVNRGGIRKDTLKYYPLFDTAGLRGVRMWYDTYARGGVNKCSTYPNDSTIVAFTGDYNCYRDSTYNLSPMVTFYNSVTNNPDSAGLGYPPVNDYGYWVEWQGNNLFTYHAGDTAGGNYTGKHLAQYNYLTGVWDSVGSGTDTATYQGYHTFQDTLWTAMYHRLMAYAEGEWVIKDVFVSMPTAIFSNLDTLFIVAGDSIYKRVGSGHEYVTYYSGYTAHQVDYGVFFLDVETNWVYIGGAYDSLQGKWCGCISRYKDGVVEPLGRGVFTNSQYSFHSFITCITKWQGKIVAAGLFRIMDNKIIGSNIAIMNPDTKEWGALDYGLDFIPWGMTVFKTKEGCLDLMIVGDNTAGGGIPVNHIVARYSEEHFAVVPPTVNYTPIADLPTTEYPPAITITPFSQASRQFTVSLTYTINDGVEKTITLSKNDSTLSTAYGVWVFNYTGTFGALDTVEADDTVNYTITAIDNLGNTTVKTDSFVIEAGVTIPLDSLKLYVEFYKDRGLGLSTYSQKIHTLYCDGTRNGDTLQLGATSSADTDDPTDSTEFGFLWFDGSNDGMKTTTSFKFDTTFTIVIKSRGYSPAGMLVELSTSGVIFLYGTSSPAWTVNSTGLAYYANWSIQNDDSVTAVTDSMQFYRNGIWKNGVYSNSNLTTNYFTLYVGCRALSSIFFKGRIYTLAIYNRRLTPAEILQWND